MRIALIQQHATWDQEANRARGLAAARQAAADGAQVIAFSELAFDRFYPQVPATLKLLDRAESIPGVTTDVFCKLAAELGVVIILNIFEKGAGQTFDSSPVIDADGTISGTSRMVHITDYEYFHEQGYYAPGDNGAPVYDTRFGRIGVAICYDRHYPEYMRVTSFHNGYFTALCNRVGKEENLVFAGESFVCAPDGEVLARAQQGTDEILHCELDLAKVGKSNARRLFFRDRRPELYKDWI